MKTESKSMLRLAMYCIIVVLAIGDALLLFLSQFAPIPEFLANILTFIVLFLSLCLLIWRNNTPAKKVLAFISIPVIMSLWGAFSSLLPYWNSKMLNLMLNKPIPFSKPLNERISTSDAITDISFAINRMTKVHPKMTDNGHCLESKVLKQFKDLYSGLDSIETVELQRFLQRCVSSLNDEHTVVFSRRPTGAILPRSYLLQNIIEIEGENFDCFLEQKRSLYSLENPSFLKKRVLQDLRSVDGTSFLGLSVQNGIHIVLRDTTGRIEKTLTVEDYDHTYTRSSTYLRDSNFISYSVQPANNLAIMRLDACSYYTAKQKRYVDESFHSFFRLISENGVQHLILDLRVNRGGTPEIAKEFIRYLKVEKYKTRSARIRIGRFLSPLGFSSILNQKHRQYLFSGKLYVLTSNQTFSAAVDFANYIQDNMIGKIIGESPDNSVNGYGNISLFLLPNSHLYFSVSTTLFCRANPAIESDYIIPDTFCRASDAEVFVHQLIAAEPNSE